MGTPLAGVAQETANQTPADSSAHLKVVMNKRDGLNYVWIPPGTFMMGCSQGDLFGRPSERPTHQVTITHGFWMCQTPVTQAAYKKVMGTNPSEFVGDQLPVDSVTWEDAKLYSQRVGMRLPTEAEWEYAERGGSPLARYAPIAQIAWYKENSGGTTQAVGLKAPNNYGLYDMLGDVLEWVSDWWGNSYSSEPAQDPQGPSEGEYHVLRGGAWWSCPEDVRVSARFSGYDPPNQNVDGFRCVAESIPDSAPAEAFRPAEPQPYHISATWKVDGDNVLSKVETEASWANVKSDENWHDVVVDPATSHLYIARDNKIEVADTATGKLVGTIGDIKGSNGIALDSAGAYGFISDGSNHQVVVFDRKTLARVTNIDVGNAAPGALLFEPATDTVWSFDNNGESATVIDGAKLQPTGTVTLPGRPRTAVSDEQGGIYVGIEDKNEVARIDAQTRSVIAEWPSGCQSPSGITIDLTGNRLFLVGRRQSAVLDDKSGKVLATVDVGEGAEGACFSARRNVAFAATEDGFLSVVDFNAPGYPVVEKLITYPGARTITYDPQSDRIYTVSADTQMITPPTRGGGSSPQDMGGGPDMGGPPQDGGGPGGGPGGGGGGPAGGGGGPAGGGGPGGGPDMGGGQDFHGGGPTSISDPRSHGQSKRIVIPGTFVVFVIDRDSAQTKHASNN